MKEDCYAYICALSTAPADSLAKAIQANEDCYLLNSLASLECLPLTMAIHLSENCYTS